MGTFIRNFTLALMIFSLPLNNKRSSEMHFRQITRRFWLIQRFFFHFVLAEYSTSLVFLQQRRLFAALTVHPREKKSRKLWNFRNCFFPSQTHLLVVILTAAILFEVIVLLRKLLRKKKKSVGQALAFLLSYASTQFLRSRVILKVDLATYWQIRGRELIN